MNEEQILQNKYFLKEDILKFFSEKCAMRKKAGYADSTDYFLFPTPEFGDDAFILIRICDHNFNVQNLDFGFGVLWKAAYKNQEEEYHDILGMLSVQIHEGQISPTEAYHNHLFNKWRNNNPAIIKKIGYDISKVMNLDDIQYQTDLTVAIKNIKTAINKALTENYYE